MPRPSDHVNSNADSLPENAVIDAIVPDAPELDTDELLDTQYTGFRENDDELHLASNIPRRQNLYLDENVAVYIVLRTSFVDEDTLQSQLSRLNIALDVVVVGGPLQPPEDGKPVKAVKDLLVAHKITDADDEPMVVVGGSSSDAEEATDKVIYVIWKVQVHLLRSKVRCTNPTVHFIPSASLRPARASPKAPGEQYLPSGRPASMNIFEVLQGDPQFRNGAPVLMSSRLAKVPPAPHLGEELSRQLKTAPRRPIRILPALNSRLRFSRVGLSPRQSKVLATLEIEVSSQVTQAVTLNSVDLQLTNGTANPITPSEVLQLPLKCYPRDEISFLYDLIPTRLRESEYKTEGKAPHALSFSATATVHHQGTNYQSEIKLSWRTAVDLSYLTKPYHFAALNASSDTPTHDINMTISGPSKVHVREKFTWDLLIANRSKTRSLRLALIPIPKLPAVQLPRQVRPQALTDQHRHKSVFSNSSVGSGFSTGGSKPTDSASNEHGVRPGLEPIMDPYVLFSHTHPSTALHHDGVSSSSIDPAEIIVLSADLVVGPIPPGACHTAEMEFLPLKEGVLNLDAVRVVDLDSREGLDIVWLPDIVAAEPQAQHDQEDDTSESS